MTILDLEQKGEIAGVPWPLTKIDEENGEVTYNGLSYPHKKEVENKSLFL